MVGTLRQSQERKGKDRKGNRKRREAEGDRPWLGRQPRGGPGHRSRSLLRSRSSAAHPRRTLLRDLRFELCVRKRASQNAPRGQTPIAENARRPVAAVGKLREARGPRP